MKLDGAAMQAAPDRAARAKIVAGLFPTMEFVSDSWEHFSKGIATMGALGESWVEGVKTSPR